MEDPRDASLIYKANIYKKHISTVKN